MFCVRNCVFLPWVVAANVPRGGRDGHCFDVGDFDECSIDTEVATGGNCGLGLLQKTVRWSGRQVALSSPSNSVPFCGVASTFTPQNGWNSPKLAVVSKAVGT